MYLNNSNNLLMEEHSIPQKISVDVCYYIDEEGHIHFDFEEMAQDFENKLAELDETVTVVVSIESD
jgi:hypothetical protein